MHVPFRQARCAAEVALQHVYYEKPWYRFKNCGSIWYAGYALESHMGEKLYRHFRCLYGKFDNYVSLENFAGASYLISKTVTLSNCSSTLESHRHRFCPQPSLLFLLRDQLPISSCCEENDARSQSQTEHYGAKKARQLQLHDLLSMAASDDETYTIPLANQRVFGAGIQRQRVKFVASSSRSSPPGDALQRSSSAADAYRSIVLKSTTAESQSEPPSATLSLSTSPSLNPTLCEVCSLPLTQLTPLPNGTPHEASLVHQVCLPHNHPPSCVDRGRKGLAILQSYGWDPDERRGLGVTGEGILHPIKAREKKDKMGVGAKLDKASETMKRKKEERLDAGKVRKRDDEERRKTERLRRMFYANEDLERYLGSAA